MTHEEFVQQIVGSVDSRGRVKSRERNDLEYKESFGLNSYGSYAKTMAAFANNQGGYILFGIKDNPRTIVGVNEGFNDFRQEKFTEALNSLFSPELIWEPGIVDFDGFSIGYIYTAEAIEKPVIALKGESSSKITNGDVYYRYRARSEKIKYPEMRKIIEDRARQERERILKLVEAIKRNDTTNLGIINYNNGKLSTPYGADITVDKKLVLQVLRKAKYIKSGSFDENGGTPVLKVTGNIDLAEEVPVPNIDPDIQYPYLQKQLAERLGIKDQFVYALVWYFKMKNQKKYHMEISTTSKGTSKAHKFSGVALDFLAKKIDEHSSEPAWLEEISNQYKHRNK